MAKRNGNRSTVNEILPPPAVTSVGRPAFNMTASEAAERLAKAAEGKSASQSLAIPKLNLQTATLYIAGKSSLIQHKESEKMVKELISRQMQEGKLKKKDLPPRVPEEEFKAAQHLDEDGDNAIPCYALKACLLTAVRSLPGNEGGKILSKQRAGGMFQIIGNFVKLVAPPPVMRTDLARLPSGVPMPVFRPEFWPWGCKFDLTFNASIIEATDILNLVELAGFCAGLHEWRPEKGGSFGQFRLITSEEFDLLVKEVKTRNS